mmetsp:Transcript_27365/g.51324  ORF Transcript_27365/g.51324 Transcript_27365/m.51324 type:complete len:268 (-) Transcript_27365:122-925(-)
MGQVCSGQKGESHKGSAVGDVTTEDLAALEDQQNLHSFDQSQLSQNQQHPQHSSASSLTGLQQASSGNALGTGTSAEEKERLKALQLEQQRLDMIVSTAGRGMVSVRSTRGSTGYYDQGFAAALAQHLEQTTSFPNRLPVALPPAPSEQKGSSTASSPGQQGVDSTDLGTKSASEKLDSASDGKINDTGSSNDKSVNENKSKSSLFSRLSQPQWEGIALGPGDGLAGCAGENPHRYMDNIAESLLDTTLPAKQQLFAGVQPMVENLV